MTRQLDLTVQGVVGTSPVLSRVGDSARPYCRFRVAVTPTYRTEQGWNNAETIWFTAKAWGQLAANLSHSLRKGDAVLLTGRFSQESWESNGRKHETNVITLQAAGHDLTRGESRFARVKAAESAPSASSGGGTGDVEPEPGGDEHVSSDHWEVEAAASGAPASPVPGPAAPRSPPSPLSPPGSAGPARRMQRAPSPSSSIRPACAPRARPGSRGPPTSSPMISSSRP